MIATNNLSNRLGQSLTLHKDVTFAHAKAERIHRWFPYLEGFGEQFIRDVLAGSGLKPQTLYEPFAGSGTLPVYCQLEELDVLYSEINPFLQQLIALKLDLLQLNTGEREAIADGIGGLQHAILSGLAAYPRAERLEKSYAAVFGQSVYFRPEAFEQVLRYRTLADDLSDAKLKGIAEMAACEALLHASLLKRAGDIRYKRGRELNQIAEFGERVCKNLERIRTDLLLFEDATAPVRTGFTPNAKVLDERFVGQADMCITSPPYLNGTNYIRNAKLELWFLGFLMEKKDLAHYRKLVVTAGINDVSTETKEIHLPRLEALLADPALWYDRRIPKMIKDYFFDMQEVFHHTYQYLKPGGLACIDIGDSIYGGIHIPTDEMLIDLLLNSGFKLIDNIKLRSRRSKSGALVKQMLIVVQK